MTIMGQINVRSRTGILSGQPTRKLSLEGSAASFKGGGEAVHVNNISRTGMLLETSAPLSVGEPLHLLLPEGSTCTAIVVWANETVYACEFDKTLTSATISQIQLQSAPIAHVMRANGSSRTRGRGGEALGERIRRLRRERGFSMVHFASCVGVSKPTLWKWEKGAVFPRQDMIGVIARTLGVPEKELIYGEDAVQAGHGQPLASGTFALPDKAIADKKSELALIMGISPERIRILIEA
ncbi:helix-turn-helix domain-containing protein [Novosphingobium sp.]|uniref:helix-turn-helix domain-containing protein n=1 Tax=Novosphingobium sp. TaxID=1874826 RepID=UPI002B466EFC|nr:helix-turn-helix domain-containing protein [Novosphingobium sp.]HKR91200.1 helix-turn-helix domain-containing protein [Novosphingobium sp.]